MERSVPGGVCVFPEDDQGSKAERGVWGADVDRQDAGAQAQRGVIEVS